MRIISSAAVVMVGLFVSTSPHAFSSTGTIESVYPAANEIRLMNGDAYRLPADVDISGFKAGQRVQVTWESQAPSTTNIGGEHFIRSLTATEVRMIR